MNYAESILECVFTHAFQPRSNPPSIPAKAFRYGLVAQVSAPVFINRYALLVTVISLLPKEGFKEIEDFYRPEAAIEKDTVV